MNERPKVILTCTSCGKDFDHHDGIEKCPECGTPIARNAWKSLAYGATMINLLYESVSR